MGGGLPAAAATGSANNGDAGVIHDPINDVVSSSKSGSGSHSGSTYTSSCPALSLTPALAARLADDAVRAVYADCAYSSYSDVAKQVPLNKTLHKEAFGHTHNWLHGLHGLHELYGLYGLHVCGSSHPSQVHAD